MIAERTEIGVAGGLTVELLAGRAAAEADTRVAQAPRAGDIGALALYEAMEDGRVSHLGATRRLARFTVIGATTDEDLLLGALRDRSTVRQDLEFYAGDDLVEIIRRKAGRWSLEIDGDAATRIAAVSRETPRVAVALLHAVRDETELRGLSVIDLGTASDVLLLLANWG